MPCYLVGEPGLVLASAPPTTGPAPLPAAFWVAAGVLVCVTAAEWCVTAWGATFVDDVVGVSTDRAIAPWGVLRRGRARPRARQPAGPAPPPGPAARGRARRDRRRLRRLWPSTAPARPGPLVGLLGVGLGNLFPMALSLAVSVAPGRAGPASGRAVTMTSLAVLLAPLTVGALADASSLKSALGVVPVMLALAALGLVLVRRTARASAVSRG